MQIKTYRGKHKMTMDLAELASQLDDLHPKVASIIKQVKGSYKISKADKNMIEQQLISLCGTLNEVKSYTIVPGRWKKDNVYSDQRAREAENNKTIRNETVFTIISYQRRNHWVVYIDLPIDVSI